MSKFQTGPIEFHEIVDRYGNMLINLAYSFCRNKTDAEDVVQDVFIKYIQKAPNFLSEEHQKAWLMRVTINTAINYKNTFWNKNKKSLEDYEMVSVSAETEEIWDDVRKLPDKYRIVIDLYYREGLSIKEIAFVLGKSESTVGTQLERGRKKLKNLMGSK